jgi:hypothetical protein
MTGAHAGPAGGSPVRSRRRPAAGPALVPGCGRGRRNRWLERAHSPAVISARSCSRPTTSRLTDSAQGETNKQLAQARKHAQDECSGRPPLAGQLPPTYPRRRCLRQPDERPYRQRPRGLFRLTGFPWSLSPSPPLYQSPTPHPARSHRSRCRRQPAARTKREFHGFDLLGRPTATACQADELAPRHWPRARISLSRETGSVRSLTQRSLERLPDDLVFFFFGFKTPTEVPLCVSTRWSLQTMHV